MSQLAYQNQVLFNFTQQHNKNTTIYTIGHSIATTSKERYKQLENQWQLINLHDEASISRQQIQRYFRNKGAYINESVLSNLLNRMKWHGNRVYKQQFCSQALDYERQLSSSSNYEQYIHEMGEVRREIRDKYGSIEYVWMDIKRVEIAKEISDRHQQFRLNIEYHMRNGEMLRYEVAKYDPEDRLPRFMLPCVGQRLNLSVYLLAVDGQMLGSTFINSQVDGWVQLENTIRMDGKDRGVLRVEMDKREEREEGGEDRRLELEYLQYLFGCQAVTNPKVPINQVKYVIFLRYFIIITVLVGAIVNHLGGRYDSITLILAVYLLRLGIFVWQKAQVVNMYVLTLLSMLADIAWVALSIHETKLSIYTTYGSIIVKCGFVIYLTARETSPL